MATYLEEIEATHAGKFKETSTGLKYVVLQEGDGKKPSRGTLVTAHYTGKHIDGEQFDSSVGRGPFEFNVGRHEVISGWDEAFLDMSKGEKRILVLPPELGYGDEEIGPIPANSTLIFEVELLDF